jgi:Rps23 Pro-64 3,4-dihydroxylase Tpa1-like proline 4-hydroxylase
MNAQEMPSIRNAEDQLGLLKLLNRFDAMPTETFVGAQPFPHLVLDNAFEPEITDRIHRQFFSLPDTSWDKSNDGVEVKWRSNWKSEYDIPEPGREVVRFLNSGRFLRSLSRVTGIPNLIPDPYYTGGGFNLLKRGGYLDVHVDGNWHDAMRVHRRLNLLVYLNSSWKDEWGGHLGFYDAEGQEVVQAISPVGNRLVVFETHDKSFHGHPEPLVCPDNEARTSIILYYYTSAPRPADQVVVAEPHSALWRSRDWHDKRGNKTRT